MNLCFKWLGSTELKSSKEHLSSNVATSTNTTEKTAESTSPSGATVILHHRDLWAKFHKATTEMIITKAGRCVLNMPIVFGLHQTRGILFLFIHFLIDILVGGCFL